jgi:hypothetical protein
MSEEPTGAIGPGREHDEKALDEASQGDVPGVRGGAMSQDTGTESPDLGTAGDEGGAGAYPGGPTFSDEPSERGEAEAPIPTEEISGPPQEPPD